eukprot:2453416-Rhodomonas_salina.1
MRVDARILTESDADEYSSAVIWVRFGYHVREYPGVGVVESRYLILLVLDRNSYMVIFAFCIPGVPGVPGYPGTQ